MSGGLVMGTTTTPGGVAQVVQVQPSVGTMLSQAIASGVTAENVAVLEKMMDLYERTQAKEAEKEFARAFVALQSEMPQIRAVKPVPNNDGSIRYRFAPYEEIMDAVRPLLLKHGFTVSFSQTVAESRITQACTLRHVGGHSVTNSFAVRIGKGPPGSSEAQGDGAASTYAKRFALCDALNIVIEKDVDGATDARVEGTPISADKAQYLRELVRDTGSDEAAFLKFAGAKTYAEIMSSRYDDCARALHKKLEEKRRERK